MVNTMDLQTFKDSIANPEPPAGLSPALEALWWDAKGDWDKAHEFAQKRDDRPDTLVHAYLHRKEAMSPMRPIGIAAAASRHQLQVSMMSGKS